MWHACRCFCDPNEIQDEATKHYKASLVDNRTGMTSGAALDSSSSSSSSSSSTSLCFYPRCCPSIRSYAVATAYSSTYSEICVLWKFLKYWSKFIWRRISFLSDLYSCAWWQRSCTGCTEEGMLFLDGDRHFGLFILGGTEIQECRVGGHEAGKTGTICRGKPCNVRIIGYFRTLATRA